MRLRSLPLPKQPTAAPEIVVGQPLVFDKNNVADWIDIL